MNGKTAPNPHPIFHGRSLDPGTLGFQVPFQNYAAAAATAGFDHIEVAVSHLRDLGPQTVLTTVAELGLTPKVFSCPWGMPANGSVSTYAFARRLASLPRILDSIASAGGQMVSAFFASERPGMTKLSRDELLGRCEALARMASDSGLDFCVELNDVSVLRDAGSLVRDLPQLRLLFDSFHFFRAGLPTEWFATIPALAIGWVHLSDVPHGTVPTDEGGPRAWPGLGQQDLVNLLTGLAANGYTGPLSLEILPAPDAATDLSAYAADLLAQTQLALDRAGAIWTQAHGRAETATVDHIHPQR